MLKYFYFSLIFLGQLVAEDHLFIGKHYLASYYDCDHEALINTEALKKCMLDAAASSGASILDTVDFTFSGDGITMVLLLEESHASIHTYPEYDACFVDLFTCGDKCSSYAFEETLMKYLIPKDAERQILSRG
ncbi:MAG: adenosylmethionine decarboxylase [Simkaniaceae bacterium]|nr:adenosylmethionine decarboxylase [Simkaniaceae bacterium]